MPKERGSANFLHWDSLFQQLDQFTRALMRKMAVMVVRRIFHINQT